MTERHVHYHKSGTVTARLELVMPEDGSASDFVRRHSSLVRESFDGAISAAADGVYERMRARGRAYRYRPCVLRVEYAVACRRRTATVDVSVMCAYARRVVYAAVERHRLRLCAAGAEYIGMEKVK